MPTGPVSRPWRRYLRFSVRGLIVVVIVIGVGLRWLVQQARVQRDAVAAITAAGGSVNYDWELSYGKYIPGAKPWAPRWLTNQIGVDFFGHVSGVFLYSPAPATDEAIVQVGRLTRLEVLGLGPSASDKELEHWTGLTKLSFLDLSNTQVTDAGLAHLKGLTNLSFLSLSNTQVTDAGLAHLKGLTNLSFLSLERTRVTDAGLKELKRALPSLWIFR